jgi:hypothetical protein
MPMFLPALTFAANKQVLSVEVLVDRPVVFITNFLIFTVCYT